MTESSGVPAAVLTVVTVLSLTVLSLLCLRCKRKSKIIEEEHQVYNTQMFQRGGSMFAVTTSKTVTQPNQITSPIEIDLSTEATGEQPDYENVMNPHVGSVEHTYVAPLAISLYENEQREKQMSDADQTPDVYANVFDATSNNYDDDYENTTYLNEAAQEEEECEPDYVNENGEG